MVLPLDVSADFLDAAGRLGLGLRKRMTIVPIAGKVPNRVNLELVWGQPVQVVEETLTLRDTDNRFTAQYNEFLKDFYLGL